VDSQRSASHGTSHSRSYFCFASSHRMLLLLEIAAVYGVRAVRKSRKRGGPVLARSRARFSPCLADGSVHSFGSATRFNEKRMLTAEEVIVSNAYLRCTYCPLVHSRTSGIVSPLCDSRLETYRRLPIWWRPEMERPNLRRSRKRSGTEQIAATRLSDSHPSAGLLLLPRAKQHDRYFSTTRTMALHTSSSEDHLCAFCSAWVSYALCWLVLRMSSGQHRVGCISRFHTPYGHHRLRHARRRYPRGGFNRLNRRPDCWSISASI